VIKDGCSIERILLLCFVFYAKGSFFYAIELIELDGIELN